jgi:hypothetical protein
MAAPKRKDAQNACTRPEQPFAEQWLGGKLVGAPQFGMEHRFGSCGASVLERELADDISTQSTFIWVGLEGALGTVAASGEATNSSAAKGGGRAGNGFSFFFAAFNRLISLLTSSLVIFRWPPVY